MNSRSRFLLFVVTPIFICLYSYLAFQIIWRYSFDIEVAVALSFALLLPFLFSILMPIYVWRGRGARSAHKDALIRSAYFSMALLSFLFFLFFLRDSAWLILKLFSLALPESSSFLDLFFSPSVTIAILMLALLGIIIGYFSAISGLKREEVKIRVAKKAKLKLVQISDLHIGAMIGREYVSRVVDKVNKESADFILLTGDIIDDDTELHRDSIKELGRLQARLGVYYVTGNHEYYWNVEKCLKAIIENNIRPLINEHIFFPEENFVLAGVSDYRSASIYPSHRSDPGKALTGAPENALKLILAHQPASAFEAQKAGADIMLAGHTHGGQFIPWTWGVKKVHDFDRGLHKFKEMFIYVSRGTGYWGPPIRLGSSAEYSVIEIIGECD